MMQISVQMKWVPSERKDERVLYEIYSIVYYSECCCLTTQSIKLNCFKCIIWVRLWLSLQIPNFAHREIMADVGLITWLEIHWNDWSPLQQCCDFTQQYSWFALPLHEPCVYDKFLISTLSGLLVTLIFWAVNTTYCRPCKTVTECQPVSFCW